MKEEVKPFFLSIANSFPGVPSTILYHKQSHEVEFPNIHREASETSARLDRIYYSLVDN